MNFTTRILIMLAFPILVWAQDGWHVVAGGSSSIPMGGLSEWFKPDVGLTVGIGRP